MSIELRHPGVYVVTMTNDEPISVNADRPGRAELCIRVNRENCKFGKAQDLFRRRREYARTFKGAERFHPIATVSNPEVVETLVSMALDQYRIIGPTGRPNEWLQGVSAQYVHEVILEALVQSGQSYSIVGTLEL